MKLNTNIMEGKRFQLCAQLRHSAYICFNKVIIHKMSIKMCSCWRSAGRVHVGTWLNVNMLRRPTHGDQTIFIDAALTDVDYFVILVLWYK